MQPAGIKLVWVTEGLINGDDFPKRVMYSLKQEDKHQFLRDRLRNVSRGQIRKAQRGLFHGQAAPDGCDRKTWLASPRIAATLRTVLGDADQETAEHIVQQLAHHHVKFDGLPGFVKAVRHGERRTANAARGAATGFSQKPSF